MVTEPAPRPNENNPIIAPQYVPLVENGLIEARGVIPGEPPSQKVVLEEDNLVSGRGVIP